MPDSSMPFLHAAAMMTSADPVPLRVGMMSSILFQRTEFPASSAPRR